ncbi:retrovirus-related pol polyprotein from transposon TNT 1-94 [Tanacetum coccineum]
MEQKVNDKSPTENILENEIDRLLEASLTSEIRNCVLLLVEQQKHELLKVELEKSASDSRDIQANLLKRIKILENDFQRSQAQSIDFELKLQHQKEKMDCDVSWKAKLSTLHDENVIQLVLWIVDSKCSKHMTGNLQLLRNFIEKFMGTFRFGNDHFAGITGFGQFCDGDLEVAFRSNMCYVWNLEGDDLVTGSRGSNLYTISIFEMAASSSVCLMSRATSTKSWLCKKDSLPPKLVPSTESKLELLHMDLCGPMRVTSINGKKYILMIVDDYSQYTLVYFLRTKDEAPDMIIDFDNQVQRNLKALILTIQTDNGTKFKNEKLRAFYAKRNRTLVEAARTMLIFSKAPEFLWAEAIATSCFTQNRSIVHTRHNKTLYELIRGRKPNVQYFHVFGSLCYLTNNRDDLGKMKPKADIRIFVGYSESSRGFRIYNRHTKKIMETIHVKFDKLTAMASECNNLEPGMNCVNFNNSSEDSQSVPSTSDLDNLFGPMYKEYYATRSQEVFDNSAANTLDNDPLLHHRQSSLNRMMFLK